MDFSSSSVLECQGQQGTHWGWCPKDSKNVFLVILSLASTFKGPKSSLLPFVVSLISVKCTAILVIQLFSCVDAARRPLDTFLPMYLCCCSMPKLFHFRTLSCPCFCVAVPCLSCFLGYKLMLCAWDWGVFTTLRYALQIRYYCGVGSLRAFSLFLS